MVKKVAIVGAGPSGVLLAHYLLRRGDKYQIDIYDRRNDPRLVEFSKYRTFSIALNNRGMSALQKIEGLEKAVKAITVETTGSITHQKNGKMRRMQRKTPFFTADRTNLAIALLNALTKKYDNSRLNIHFNSKCIQVDLATKKLKFQKLDEALTPINEGDLTVDYDLLIGADGVHSVVRESLLTLDFFECDQKSYRNDYKTIFLPNPNEKPGLNLEPGKIHSWRSDGNTAILLVYQLDGTISGVIYFPRGKNQIVGLSSSEEVLQFFQDNFPEIGQLMPKEEAEAFLARPVSSVLTIRCNRYHYSDSVLLIGDAAHAVSPSLGQGCNAALEDVAVFDKLLDQYSDDIALALEQFTINRKEDAHALAELSENAFPSSSKLFIEFLIRESFAKSMHQLFPKYFSPSMMDLIFSSTVPYSEILNSYKGWMSKLKKSNEKFLANL
ncbi:MAG: FAD-dependent monooxygenase [Tolypothrix sp. Co-bin9]|nr:FAD-dependent monooxygenase [Tolypothrix sp. Co-bin9]